MYFYLNGVRTPRQLFIELVKQIQTSEKFIFWSATVALLLMTGGCTSFEKPKATETKATPSATLASSSSVEVALLQKLHDQLYAQLQELIGRNQGARKDGYVYTVDFSQVLVYAALNKDRRLYEPLRDFAVRNLVVNKSSDPYTRGFVLWRYREGSPPDASGTTEALRLAQSLWLGSQVFGNVSDRHLAVLILQGYARHAHTDHGMWLIRNYFNLQTRAFATNSFLVGYDPDFLQEVGQAIGEPTLSTVAQKSYTLVRQAITPSGLLYDIIQPEVLTLVPELKNLTIFSPNDIVKLDNTCTVAERVTAQEPEVGHKVLHFALSRLPALNTYYYGRTGEPLRKQEAGATTYACLVRLAEKLDEQEALNSLLSYLVTQAEFFTKNPDNSSVYTVVEILLALQMVLKQEATS